MPKLALLGGDPIRSEPFPWDSKEVNVDSAEEEAVLRVIRGRKLSDFYKNFLGGKEVQGFEQDVAHWFHEHNTERDFDVKVASCNSGTAALHMAYAACGLGCGDRILMPAYTFTSTATAAVHHNAIPIFIDIDPNTYNIDPVLLPQALVEWKPKAVCVVHIHGNPCDMALIMDIIEAHDHQYKTKTWVIEDCAQAFGASIYYKSVGMWGDIATFSLQHTKVPTCGEGGFLITGNDVLLERARLIRNHGEAYGHDQPRDYMTKILGWNYRMTELEAAIARVQLQKSEEHIEAQRRNAQALNHGIFQVTKGRVVAQGIYRPEAVHTHSLWGSRISWQPAYDTCVSRETLIEALRAEGVPATTGYPRPIYENYPFKNLDAYGDNCPFFCAGIFPRDQWRLLPKTHPDLEYKIREWEEKHLIQDYPNLKLGWTEKLCKETALWLDVHRYPATLPDMMDVVAAFEKVFDHCEELQTYAKEKQRRKAGGKRSGNS